MLSELATKQTGCMYRLDPYIGSDRLRSVAGRVKRANVPCVLADLVILPGDHHHNVLSDVDEDRSIFSDVTEDRGFVGAKNELEAALDEMQNDKIRRELLKDGCDWISFKINFPHASHLGPA